MRKQTRSSDDFWATENRPESTEMLGMRCGKGRGGAGATVGSASQLPESESAAFELWPQQQSWYRSATCAVDHLRRRQTKQKPNADRAVATFPWKLPRRQQLYRCRRGCCCCCGCCSVGPASGKLINQRCPNPIHKYPNINSNPARRCPNASCKCWR